MVVRLTRWPLPFALLAALSLSLLAAVLAAWVLAPEGGLVYRNLPLLSQELERTTASEAASLGPPQPALPEGSTALLEPGPYGALPRVAGDGTTPFAALARPDPGAPGEVPLLALIVLDLGLMQEYTQAALALPEPTALGFSPYAPALQAWMGFARTRGYELLLELPAASPDPRVDAGPLALAPGDRERLSRGLFRLLARGRDYYAVALSPGAFAQDPRSFAPIARELRRRGLGLVEIGSDSLRPLAEDIALPYLGGAMRLDQELAPAAVDQALGALETRALRQGWAVGAFRAAPLLFARLRQWLPTLPEKGFLLVPPSRLFGRTPQPAVAQGP